MPLDIRTTYREHHDAPRALVEEIDAHMAGLFECRIQWFKGKNYFDTPLGVGKIDEVETTPDHIGRELWKLCRDHSRKKGSGRYRIEYRIKPEDGGKIMFEEGNGFFCAIDDDGSALVPTTDELPNVWSVVKDMVQDPHKRYCDILDKIPPLLDSLAKAKDAKGKWDVEAKRLDNEAAEQEARAEVQMEFIKEGASFLKDFAQPFGVNLADVAEDFLRSHMRRGRSSNEGEAMHDTGDPLLRKWGRLWDDVEADGGLLDQVRTLIGDDLWALAQAMRHAADDHEFCNQASVFAKRVQDMPEREELLMQLAMTLGSKRAMELRNILNRATGSDEHG